MEKVGDDQWLSGAVTSTFQIQVHTDASGTIRPRRVNEGTVYTDNCGLGWRFGIGADEQPTGTTFNADGGSIKSYKIQFIFDPHLITTAEYGELSVSIDAGPLIFIGVGAGCISCSLPQRNRSTFDIGTYMLLSNLRSTPTLMIRVGLPAKLSFLPQPQPHWFPVEKALEQSLSGKEFVDVKFYAFRKHGSRGAYEPSAIYANSYLLRGHSDDLDTCLFPDGFSESTRVELDYHAPDNLHATYDYESDSDLEGDENHGPSTTMFPKSNEPSIVPPVVSWNFLSRDEPSRRSSHAITVKTAHSRHKNDELSNNPDDPGSPGVTPELPPDALLADEQSEPQVIPLPLSRSNTPDTVQGFTRTGRVIVIKDIAFRTWRSFVYYLYTRKITFSSLKSEHRRSEGFLFCSPKSMYRLADKPVALIVLSKYGLTELQDHALAAIRSRLHESNIVEETFSAFTSFYPKVQEIEVEFLINHLNSPKVTEDLCTVWRLICAGDRPHSFEASYMMLQKTMERPVGDGRGTPREEGSKERIPDFFSAPPSRAPSPANFGRYR